MPWPAVVFAGLLVACTSPSEDVDSSSLPPAASSGVHTDLARSPTLSVSAEFEAIAAELEAGDALFIGGSREADLRRKFAATKPGSSTEIELLVRLGRELLRLGDSAGGLEQLREALRLEEIFWLRAPPDPERRTERHKKLLFQLVLGASRLGEQVNCVGHHTASSCILPIHDDGVHLDPIPARAAMEYAQRYLKLAPGDLKAIWFLNLSAMQAGEYPRSVPEDLRLPQRSFAADSHVGIFRNLAFQLGMSTFDNAGGCVADDFDGDGLYDLVTSSMDPSASLTLLRNAGDGTLADRTAGSGLEEQLGGLNLMHADYDGDGRVDLLVLRGGWLQNQGKIRNSLLRNEGDMIFADVTRAAGIAVPALPTQTGAWADYDGDGNLDLFIGNEGEKRGERMELFADNLFRNNGDGTLGDVAPRAGVTNDRYTKGAGWGDYDGDGDPDLYVSNVGPNRLYRNDGGVFTDVAPQLDVTEPEERSFATWFFDYDNDGDLDLFVASYLAGVADVAADIMGRDTRPELWPRLYRNDGGDFFDATVVAGLNHPSLPMGANFGDIDEDGFPDIYLGTGSPSFESVMPNVLFHNERDGTFTDVTFAAGFGHLQKGHGIAFADFDHDGDTDVALQAGGFYPGDRFANALFENPGHGRRFLSVKAVGVGSNRGAIGTRLHVRLATPVGERSVYRWVSTGGSFGGSPLEQCIGLGDATEILALDLVWPTTGQTQTFNEVPLDASVRVEEGAAQYELQRRRAFRMAPRADNGQGVQ